MHTRPYGTRIVNIISYFNEAAVSMYLYMALLLTDYLYIENNP
jgi:hypothetical protein